MKLLLDENMSPWVAQELCKAGIDACHVRDRGMLGDTDTQVLDKAFDEDRIVVTCNIDDFVDLAGDRELHAGVILVEQADLRRQGQLDLVRRAIVAIEQQGDLINQVLRVALDGTMAFEDIPTE